MSKRQAISLCMIVRDAASCLRECLSSVVDLVDEAIVVDTGSSDETRAIAAHAGARVAEYAWTQDFASARNESLRLATSDWVLRMDADEVVDDENRRKFRDLRSRLPPFPAGIMMRVRSRVAGSPPHSLELDEVRLFSRHPQVHWQYRVHEQITPSLRAIGARLFSSSVIIDHHGYQDADCLANKVARNLAILELEVTERPEDPFVLFNLGDSLSTVGRFEEAVGPLEKCLAISRRRFTFLRRARVLLVGCYRVLGRHEVARDFCSKCLHETPDEPHLLLAWAELMCIESNWSAAEETLRRLLGGPMALLPTPLVRGSVDFHAKRLLALASRKSHIPREECNTKPG